jgi:eukaryotic-like serine/threonine-protein kinase
VYALDAVTGDIRWRREVGGPPAGTFALGDGRIFLRVPDRFLALDAATGTVAWTLDPRGGLFGPPLVHAGVVLIAMTSLELRAVDVQSGAERWRIETPAAFGRPVIADGVLYIGTDAGRVYAFTLG